MTSTLFKAVRGMNDLLPESTAEWAHCESVLCSHLESYGYQQVRTPIVEATGLFTRSIGAVTDIVEKEMYTFVDALNGDSLTLRPEATAACVRLALEHDLLRSGPRRLWYQGPMFRHERPQKGRYRQFHQCGAEALGFAGPDVDAEIIVLTARLWQVLGLSQVTLQLNSIGSPATRRRYLQELTRFFAGQRSLLDAESLRRLDSNPLRILDSKNPELLPVLERAPNLLEFLDPEAEQHFQEVQGLLNSARVPFQLNPRLVRGLDYYNATVFEWTTPLLGAQSTICGGGRYDGLVEQLGGKPTPACGFALGMERLMAVLEADQAATARFSPAAPDVYIVHQGVGAAEAAFGYADRLRAQGFTTILHCGGGSFKSQFRRADASRACWALIVGDEELRLRRVRLKPLRSVGDQQCLEWEQALKLMAEACDKGGRRTGSQDV